MLVTILVAGRIATAVEGTALDLISAALIDDLVYEWFAFGVNDFTCLTGLPNLATRGFFIMFIARKARAGFDDTARALLRFDLLARFLLPAGPLTVLRIRVLERCVRL